jgi:hypothetical protein
LILLKMHRANLDLYRANFADAAREFRESLQLSEAGGFTDLQHYARLGLIKVDIRDARPDRLTETQGASRTLDIAETYADRMDIPRLKVEVLLLRAEMLIRQGETTLAGQLVTHGLRIANLNGLAFRRITALELLAQVYRARGHVEPADRLQGLALRAGRSMGYHLRAFRMPA